MTAMAISSGILALLLTLILFQSLLNREWVKAHRIEALKGKNRYVDEELELNLIERFFKPTLRKLSARLSKISRQRRKKKQAGSDAQSILEKNLQLAGLRISAQEFMLIRIISAFGILLLSFLTAGLMTLETDLQFLIILFGLAIGMAAPVFILRAWSRVGRAKSRNNCRQSWTFLSVSIEAGLGFDAAILKVIERYDGPLIDELALLYREIQMGKPRREALASLAARNSIQELQTFSTAVTQSDQYGTPLKNVLRNQAVQLRIARRQQAQEKGMKAPVKMVVPMVFFIFPVIFIVLLGPTVIELIKQFG
jgi:tight adherence protein C